MSVSHLPSYPLFMLLSHSCGETNGYLQCEESVVYFKALLVFWLLAVMINLSRCQLNHPTLVWKKLMTASRHYLSCVNYASHSGLSDLRPHQELFPQCV